MMARAYSEVMHENGLLATRQEWDSRDTANEDELWNKRFVTDLDELMARQSIRVITSGWPFKEQSATIEFIPPTDTLNHLAQMLAIGKLGWLEAHVEAVQYYRQREDWKNVEREYKTVISMYPHVIQPYMELASVYFKLKQLDDMKSVLLQSLQVVPTLPAYTALGHIMLDKGDPIGALKYLVKADDFYQNPTEKLQNDYTISIAYLRAGDFQKAKQRLAALLRTKPDYQPALQLLADINRQAELNSATK
jgi:tetratricopeptide (TPR) repeat protein